MNFWLVPWLKMHCTCQWEHQEHTVKFEISWCCRTFSGMKFSRGEAFWMTIWQDLLGLPLLWSPTLSLALCRPKFSKWHLWQQTSAKQAWPDSKVVPNCWSCIYCPHCIPLKRYSSAKVISPQPPHLVSKFLSIPAQCLGDILLNKRGQSFEIIRLQKSSNYQITQKWKDTVWLVAQIVHQD